MAKSRQKPLSGPASTSSTTQTSGWASLALRSMEDLQRLCRELWITPWSASDPQTKIPQGSEDIEFHRKGSNASSQPEQLLA